MSPIRCRTVLHARQIHPNGQKVGETVSEASGRSLVRVHPSPGGERGPVSYVIPAGLRSLIRRGQARAMGTRPVQGGRPSESPPRGSGRAFAEGVGPPHTRNRPGNRIPTRDSMLHV